MKKGFILGFCFLVFSALAPANEQIVEVKSFMVPAGEISIQTVEYINPLQVTIADPAWLPTNVIKYKSGQTWYMQITVINSSGITKSFKLEFNLYYGDGAGYYTYRVATSMSGSPGGLLWNTYRINVTSYIAKKGLIRLMGRVYGTGFGLNNKVEAQVAVY